MSMFMFSAEYIFVATYLGYTYFIVNMYTAFWFMFNKFGYMKKIILFKLMTFNQTETCFMNTYLWKFLAEKKSYV